MIEEERLSDRLRRGEMSVELALRAELVRAKASNDSATALATLEQLVEAARGRRGSWYFAAGEIRNELQQRGEAIDSFDMALDVFWSDEPTDTAMAMSPFEAIERMLRDARDWKQLERSYRKMLYRMKSYPAHDKLRAELYRNVGEIYRTHLRSEESANAAFEEARRLDPASA